MTNVAREQSILPLREFQGWLKEMTIWEAQGHQRFLIPVGPWPQDRTSFCIPRFQSGYAEFVTGPVNERDRIAAELLRQNFYRICASWRPALLGHYPAETVDEWIAKAQDELVTMKVHTYVGVS